MFQIRVNRRNSGLICIGLTLFFCLAVGIVYAQTSIPCGQPVIGSITEGQKNTYTFTASANDSITIRSTKITNEYWFKPYLELYTPDGKRLAEQEGQIDKTLPASGTYTLIVRDDNNSEDGDYALLWQKLNNPCNAIVLNCGQSVTGSLSEETRFRFYTFTASANDSITIRSTKITNEYWFKPYLELYTPDGKRLAEQEGQIDKTLPASGTYTLIVRDDNNSEDGKYKLDLQRPNAAPVPKSIIPSSGSSQPNEEVFFTTVFSDDDNAGWKDIAESSLLINISTDGKRCFYAYYDRSANKIYLRDDEDTSWLGGFIPTSRNIIENSYAQLDCSQSTVKGTGKTLTIKWHITFKFPFGGKTYNSYLSVIDNQKASSGWVKKGTWRVEPIQITPFSPPDRSRFIEGAIINCKVGALPTDPSYQYLFLVDGQIKRPFGPDNLWNWETASEDIGTHILTVQVKNQSGVQVEKSHRLIIYRRPIEPQE